MIRFEVKLPPPTIEEAEELAKENNCTVQDLFNFIVHKLIYLFKKNVKEEEEFTLNVLKDKPQEKSHSDGEKIETINNNIKALKDLITRPSWRVLLEFLNDSD